MEQTSPTEDVALMMRVRGGDECAFELLFGRYQHKLLNFFYGLSRNSSTARDLAQDTFLRIWKIRKRYQASGTFPAYLFGVARMIWLESCRREQKAWKLGVRLDDTALEGLTGHFADCPAYQARRTELHEHIHRALDQLPEEQRLVFVLRSIDGLSLEDIASILDCPVNTVRSRKILAVKKLRHLLATLWDADRRSVAVPR